MAVAVMKVTNQLTDMEKFYLMFYSMANSSIFFFEIEYFVLAFSKHLNPGSLAWEATSH